MKYKGKLVNDFSVSIEAMGKSTKDVIGVLVKNNIMWDTCESVAGGLVVITPVDNTLESVNILFQETSKCLKSSIHVLYDDFDSKGNNLDIFNEVLDFNLLELPEWTYDYSHVEVWKEGNFFYTKEEAIKAGKIFAKNEGLLSFKVGRKVEVGPTGVDTDFILENIADSMQSDIGEVADDYLLDVTNEHQEELEKELNNVLFRWMEKYKYLPTFYKIEDIIELHEPFID